MDAQVGRQFHPAVWARARAQAGDGAVTWQLGHERLLRTAAQRAALDAEEALWLVACRALGVHRELGYGTFVEYVSAAVGWDAHTATERIRVARALVLLPGLWQRLAEGALSWSATRELTRVVEPATEEAWLEATRGMRVREVQQLVSGRRRGDLPSTPVDEGARRHVVRFEVEGSTLALVRQAQDAYRRRTGESVDDDALVAALARAYLASEHSSETAGAAAQVRVTVCPACREGHVDAGADAVPLRPAELERLCCDVRVLPAAQTEPARAHVGPTAHGGPPAPAGLPSHAGPTSHEEPPAPAGSLAPVGPSSHGGRPAPASPAPASSAPASPVIAEVERRAGLKVATELPRTTRLAVLRRHESRCAVPGCTNTAFLHVHHTRPVSEGGGHDPDQLLPICDAHHRAVHDGRLCIGGRWSSGFTFAHADGTVYGTRALPDPQRQEASKVAFQILCHTGFKQSEARAAVDAIRGDMEPGMRLDEVVRMAFAATRDLPSQRRVSRVREPLAVYLPSWAA